MPLQLSLSPKFFSSVQKLKENGQVSELKEVAINPLTGEKKFIAGEKLSLLAKTSLRLKDFVSPGDTLNKINLSKLCLGAAVVLGLIALPIALAATQHVVLALIFLGLYLSFTALLGMASSSCINRKIRQRVSSQKMSDERKLACFHAYREGEYQQHRDYFKFKKVSTTQDAFTQTEEENKKTQNNVDASTQTEEDKKTQDIVEAFMNDIENIMEGLKNVNENGMYVDSEGDIFTMLGKI